MLAPKALFRSGMAITPETENIILRIIAATFEVLEGDLKTLLSSGGKLTLVFENEYMKVVIKRNEKGEVTIQCE
ncbi:MAG: hypothetical protein ACP6IS_08805 [Candidatus Asgardarchaeia archaeon]